MAVTIVPAAALRAHADYDDHIGATSFGFGAFVGYQFGARSGIEWGFEGFMTRTLNGGGCSSAPRTGLGPLVQVAWLGMWEPRISLALQGGGELKRNGPALSGELGLSYRFGSEQPLGLHLGVVPQLLFANLAVRYQAVRNEAWVGGGVRYLPTFGDLSQCEVVVGRPLRSELGPVTFASPSPPPPAASARERAAHGFARDAALEAASVSAFVQLALELQACSAPARLVARALRAADDEVRHAALCASLAERTLGVPVDYVLPPITPRPASDRRAALARLAEESWVDGCIGESSAARHAAAASDSVLDLTSHQALRHIARDEARHGELAWAVLEFCAAEGGSHVRDLLRGCVERPAPRAEVAWADTGLTRHGRLSARQLDAITARQRGEAQQRLREHPLLRT
ncbi:MAG: hypothetical protein ABW321_27115 [Polyangiales bacterium]